MSVVPTAHGSSHGAAGNDLVNDLLFSEQSDIAAPAADKAVIYARDNGSGKTQLVVRFSSGAVQVIATQP